MLTDKMRRTDVSIFFFYLVGSRDLFQSRLGGGTPLTYLVLSPNEIVKPGPLSPSQWVQMFKAFLKLHFDRLFEFLKGMQWHRLGSDWHTGDALMVINSTLVSIHGMNKRLL